LKHVYEKLVTR